MAPTQQNLWDNPANYRPCKQKKQHEIWVCKPPLGTVVINKLEHADAVKFTGGKTYFTAAAINADPKVKAGVQQLLQAGKAYLVKDNQTFVLCGTRGELWCISEAQLSKKYVLAFEGTPVCADTLYPHLWGTYLPWTKVRTSPYTPTEFACFVPAKIQGQIQTPWSILNINGVGVNHGKGDFVIAANVNGQPDFGSRYVVNGAVFADTYDNRGWVNNIVQGQNARSLAANMLPNLLPPVESITIPKERMKQLYHNLIEYILKYTDDVILGELGADPNRCTRASFQECLHYIPELAMRYDPEGERTTTKADKRQFYKDVIGFTDDELDIFGL